MRKLFTIIENRVVPVIPVETWSKGSEHNIKHFYKCIIEGEEVEIQPNKILFEDELGMDKQELAFYRVSNGNARQLGLEQIRTDIRLGRFKGK